MAATTLFNGPFLCIRDPEGNAVVGAKVTTFVAGTNTVLPVWHNPDLSGAWSQPIVMNAAGQSSGPVYVSPTPAIKIVAVDANDVPIAGYPCDYWSPSAVATA